MTRPTTATTTAPVTDQPRPVPPRIRPPLIRTSSLTELAEPTTPQQSAKSPPQLPRLAPLTPQPKKEASPPPPPPPLTRPVVTSTAAPKPSSPKGKSHSLGGSPPRNGSFDKESNKHPTPAPSPSIPKSIPAVPSPYQSPKPKPKATASPPSPLVLPPPQLQFVAEPRPETILQEVERKTVVFQKVMEKPSPPDHDINNYHSQASGFGKNGKKHDDNQDKGNGAKKPFVSSGDKDSSTRVITMAGENRGASMEVVLSDKNNNSRHLQTNQSDKEDTTNDSKDNKSNKKSTACSSAWPMKAFFNSNVQGINNSILMDSKFTHHDPGIHLVFSKMPPPSAHQEDGGQ